MLSFFVRSFFVAAILVIQGCGVETDWAATAHTLCESSGMTFGTDAYWRCRAAGDRDRRENQIAAFYILMGATQELSNHQAAEVERFKKGLQEASREVPEVP